MKRKRLFLFKIDFEKAYNSVNWKFLLEMMRVLGSGKKWCGWIMECVSTTESSISINGSPSTPFKLGRGLRQGDPLSPFLYLIVAEGLSRLMAGACRSGQFVSWKVGEEEVQISHLQYADDTIFFGEAKRRRT